MDTRFSKHFVAVLVVGLAALAGCSMLGGGGQRMRITNASPNQIANLRVLFPDQEIAFGNVAPNSTTDYKVFPKGVYSYAAYKYDLNGQTITQPVIDWVGEVPMDGSAFTYTISFNPNNPQMERVELMKVTRDQ